MSITQDTKAVAIATFAAVALYMSGLLVIFTPLPFIYVSIVRGQRSGAIAMLCASVAVVGIYAFALPMMASGDSPIHLPVMGGGMPGLIAPMALAILSIGYFLFFVIVALFLAEGARRKWGLVRWGGTALAAGVAIFIVMAVGALLVGSGSPVEGIKGYLGQIVGEVIKINQSSQSSNAEIGFLAEHSDEIVSFMMGIIPSLIFIFSLLAVVVNMLVSRRYIRGKHSFAHVHNVARFKLPDWVVWSIIACGVSFFANHYVLDLQWLKMIAINGAFCFGALYFLQGLAVVVYFLQGIRLPMIKAAAYIAIVLFFQAVGMAIVAIGVADVWADFRLRSWRARHSN